MRELRRRERSAAALITLENPGITPVNGAIYTIVGFTGGYRDQAIGYGGATAPTANAGRACCARPTGAVVSASDDVFIADNTQQCRCACCTTAASLPENILTAQKATRPSRALCTPLRALNCVSAVGERHQDRVD